MLSEALKTKQTKELNCDSTCIAVPILDLFLSTFVFKEQTHRASVLIISGLKLH